MQKEVHEAALKHQSRKLLGMGNRHDSPCSESVCLCECADPVLIDVCCAALSNARVNAEYLRTELCTLTVAMAW